MSVYATYLPKAAAKLYPFSKSLNVSVVVRRPTPASSRLPIICSAYDNAVTGCKETERIVEVEPVSSFADCVRK